MKAIMTSHLGWTNTKPSRIVATTLEGGQRFVASIYQVPDGQEPHAWAARQLCNRFSWDGELIGGGFPDGSMAWVFADSKERA